MNDDKRKEFLKKIKLPEIIQKQAVEVESISKKSSSSSSVRKPVSRGSSNIFPCKEDDCMLTQIVKEIINENNIDVGSLNFKNSLDLNNFRGGLRNKPNMSFRRFTEWTTLLGLDWIILYGDTLKEFREFQDEKRKKLLEEGNKDENNEVE